MSTEHSAFVWPSGSRRINVVISSKLDFQIEKRLPMFDDRKQMIQIIEKFIVIIWNPAAFLERILIALD